MTWSEEAVMWTGRSEYLPAPPVSPPTPQTFHLPPTPAPRQRKFSTTLRVIALYSYHTGEMDQLEFKAGDIIKVLECHDHAWWRGYLRGKTGLFPTNFTKPI